MPSHPALEDLVSSEQEKDFLLRLGIEALDLQDLQPGSFVPSFWPSKSERISVCFHKAATKVLKAPRSGWYDGEVEKLPTNRKRKPKWVYIRWKDPCINKGRRSWVDVTEMSWVPCFSFEQAEGVHEKLNDPGSWLKMAAASCVRAACEADATQVFLRKWWTAARRGIVHLSLTPAPVAVELRELHEARQFMASRMEDKRFWQAVNGGTLSLSNLDMPARFMAAVQEAREHGAEYISPFGIYLAPSRVVPGERGLFSLLLFHPCEIVGSWEGEWLWETAPGLFSKRSAKSKARPLEDFPNGPAIHKYGMLFQNTDIIDGKAVTVTAMIDSCRGSKVLSLEQVRARDEPFGFMNEPSTGQTANCEVQSRVNALEAPGSENRYSVLVVTMLPLPPHHEILIHYGHRYDRSYSVGDRCPELFAALSAQAPHRGEFGAMGPLAQQPSEASTAAPSTPLSTASPGSPLSLPPPEDPPPVRASKRLREKASLDLERASKAAAKQPRGLPDPHRGAPAQELPSPGDSVYVHLVYDQGVLIPHRGWFEAMVVNVAVETGRAILRWSSDRVDSGHETQMNLWVTRWLPSVDRTAVALEECRCPLLWLERAAASVRPGCEEPSLQVFFARWWTEVRWGYVRFSVTPRGVIDKLQELEKVRSFVAGVAEDEVFWEAVNGGSADAVTCPAMAGAIAEARRRGACRFFKHGLFVAKSLVEPNRYGLHTLALLHPASCVGVLDAGGTLQQQAWPRYRRQWKANALQVPNGARNRVVRRKEVDPLGDGPFAFLAAPGATGVPNCDASAVPGTEARTLLVTLLPVLPMGELLVACAGASTGPPWLFAELPVMSRF